MRWLCLVLLLVGCKSVPEQLREEGYTNIFAAGGTCPSDHPELSEAYYAERNSKSWEISVCCYAYYIPQQVGKVMIMQRYESCSRFTREMP